ncbi:MAG: ChaN family lipoprotein [bacterium]|nr:MAG: ChaN family lipoprotein [bacterium]
MIARKIIEDEIRAQQIIIAQLKREVFGIDKTVKSRYIKDFYSEFTRFRRVCTIEQIIDEAAGRDILYFGDYHPLDASQEFVLRLMSGLAERGRKVVLALEMLYIQQQEFLDLWMKGRIDEEEFLEAIDYRSEWGFRWESYRRIFEHAKDPFVPIFGIDTEHRDHLRLIRKRDRIMAKRIRNIRRFFPDSLVLVVIGESHLASNHLPFEVRKVCQDRYRDIIVVQNIDDLYWKLLRKGRETVEAVEIDRNRYCVFTASPILKYQSYRQIIDYWFGGEDVSETIQMLREMVSNILFILLGEEGELSITMRDGWKVGLEEAFPEVLVRKTYNAFSSYLRLRQVRPSDILMAIVHLRKCGIRYMHGINAFLVLKFDPICAAQETVRFVVHALRDDVVMQRRMKRTKSDLFYMAVFEEALVCFGSKIINYARDCLKTDPLLVTIDARGVVRSKVSGFSLAETRSMVRLLKYHFTLDRRKRKRVRTTRTLERIYRMGVTKRSYIIDTLGFTLGEAIYTAFHDGIVTHEKIGSLFRERFEEPGKARLLYHEWVDMVKPFRGDWAKR